MLFANALAAYRNLSTRALLAQIPKHGPKHLYDLVAVYPSRGGKGLRPALCFATCAALGGSPLQALDSAVAIELLHNGFLIHDDIQDGSERRRGAATLYRTYGVPISVNVGNATFLLALQRLMENRGTVGPQVTWKVFEETEKMMRHSLEGQAVELNWIRQNVSDLRTKDYLRMCLKKTSWYSFIYPMRVGALIAKGSIGADDFCRFGWYCGAAFQIQDDILNLTADYEKYGKEIGGDLWEGKRTLSLIHALKNCSARERQRARGFLKRPRNERNTREVAWLFRLIERYGGIEYARRVARQLAGAALLEALIALNPVGDSEHKRFILQMSLYAVNRER